MLSAFTSITPRMGRHRFAAATPPIAHRVMHAWPSTPLSVRIDVIHFGSLQEVAMVGPGVAAAMAATKNARFW
jgi:hypothetical protein